MNIHSSTRDLVTKQLGVAITQSRKTRALSSPRFVMFPGYGLLGLSDGNTVSQPAPPLNTDSIYYVATGE